MALTQSAVRLRGPAWDEEVVPALRKRLENESRTLSKRMSAISLTADDAPMPAFADPTPVRQKPSRSSSGHRSSISSSRPRQVESTNSGSSTSTSRGNPNSAKGPPSSSSSYQRSRTYSQPDSSHFPNGSGALKNNYKTKAGAASMPNDQSRSRPSEPKPTRIPKPSRTYQSNSNGNTPVLPQTNGFFSQPNTSTPRYSFDLPEGRPSHFTSSSTRSTVPVPSRSTPGLMDESPPFLPSTSGSSLGHGYDQTDEAPPRTSTDSDEQPFEHWYRGEVSRNGGVGELRVGRRQEMLEIANYGHMIRDNKRKASPVWAQPAQHYRNDSHRKKRAGSIAGLTEVERERGSVLFNEADMNAVGRVLDEAPLTDLDGELSDIASISSQHRVDYFIPGVGDLSTSAAPAIDPSVSEAAITSDRSTTPTLLPRSSESRNGQYPPTRIPGAPSRRSSESRAATPTFSNTRGAAGSVASSKTPSPPPIPPTGMRSVSGQSIPGVNGKKAVSPTNAQKKRTPVKSLKGKQAPPSFAKKDAPNDRRTSMAQYPSPGDGDNMADAIPTWTQPVQREGNWDEVVLPVVARKKGMDDHFQNADGSPQPKKPSDQPIAPAPGTFGYDPSRYRPLQLGEEPLPMDEFGRPSEFPPVKNSIEQPAPKNSYSGSYARHEETRLPARQSPPPSPAPFAHYAPQADKIPMTTMGPPGPRPPNDIPDMDEKEPGCCKCVIM